jgi:hypothetical protein
MGIITRHGGQVRAEGAVGRGIIFLLYLLKKKHQGQHHWRPYEFQNYFVNRG